MANPSLRLFGVLTDDCLYGYESLNDLLYAAFDEGDGPPDGSTLIRIDAYTVLAEGSSESLPVSK